ncbi:MAG: alpha/beta fold hydrolase [Gemmataceae bacterium]
MNKKRTVKWILITIGGLVILVIGGYWYLNWMMSQPLYTIGDVRARKNLRGPLKPPKQTDPSHWQVESDIRLSFESYGTGRPVLIVHGGPGVPYGKPWKGLESLQDRFHFYYYHQRGCGASTRPLDKFEGTNFYQNMKKLDKTLGLGAQIADIERIRQILDQEKLTIIGHSYGGFLATLYTAEFPDRVDKLILVAPAGVLTAPNDERNIFQQARAKLTEDKRGQFDAVIKEYFDFQTIFSKSDEELIDVHQRVGKYVLEAMGYEDSDIPTGPKSGGWAVFAMYFSGGRAPNYTSALKEVTAPTLIIHGKDDKMSLPGSRTYSPIRESEFVLLEREQDSRRAGHFVFDDCPKTFAEAVEKFLAKD